MNLQSILNILDDIIKCCKFFILHVLADSCDSEMEWHVDTGQLWLHRILSGQLWDQHVGETGCTTQPEPHGEAKHCYMMDDNIKKKSEFFREKNT